jgi:hypothetical protein
MAAAQKNTAENKTQRIVVNKMGRLKQNSTPMNEHPHCATRAGSHKACSRNSCRHLVRSPNLVHQ